jgi:N utilization substance protein B
MGKRQTRARSGNSNTISGVIFSAARDRSEIEDFWEFCPATPRVREFAQPLIEGMVAHLPEIDERIGRYCENYEFRRISAVDRNILPACDL